MKKALVYITPFLILVLVLIGMSVLSAKAGRLSGEAKTMFKVSSFVIALPAIILDVILRLILKNKMTLLWVIEAVAVVIFCFVFIKK
jgi:hypothetical protein